MLLPGKNMDNRVEANGVHRQTAIVNNSVASNEPPNGHQVNGHMMEENRVQYNGVNGVTRYESSSSSNALSTATSVKMSSEPLGPSKEVSTAPTSTTAEANEPSATRQVQVPAASAVQSAVISANTYTSPGKEVISTRDIKKWNEMSPRVFSDGPVGIGNKVHAQCPFPADESINGRVALYTGDITALAVDAIVNTTNESFSDRTTYSLRILSSAGPQLKQYVREHIRSCRTGDAKITPAFNLPSKYIIHSVGPKYNERYRTAAEGALYSAYTKVLQLAREHNIRTLALCPINCVRRGYPPHDGAHMALRVVRRALDKYKESFTLIIFVVEDVDVGIYDHLMPFYFPRSKAEEESAQYYLPEDIGGDSGQPVLPERRIRISVKPTAALSAARSGAQAEDLIEQSVDLTSGLNASVAVGKSSFARMMPDVDKRWKSTTSTRSRSGSDQLTSFAAKTTRYERILRSVRTQDFKELDDLKFIYTPSSDPGDRAILVVLGYKIPFARVDPEYLLHYFVQKMDPLVSKPYSIIYFHALTTPDNLPSGAWMNNVFDTIPEKYLYNLTAFYIVHSNFWAKLYTWWFTTFNEGSLIKHKIIHLGGVQYLAGIIPLSKLALPQALMDYDFKVNSIAYGTSTPYSNGRG